MLAVPGLPLEILSDILSRLTVEDIARYRSVCKTWYELTMETQFIDIQQKRKPQAKPYLLLQPCTYQFHQESSQKPLYLINKAKGNTDQYCRIHKFLTRGLPEIHMRVVASSNGLLCLVPTGKEVSPVYLYNPITKECLGLPTPMRRNSDTDKFGFGFGFDEESRKYKVVLASQSLGLFGNMKRIYGQILTVGESSWREINFGVYSETTSRLLTMDPVFLNGAFHWLIPYGSLHRILVLDIGHEKLEFVKFPRPTGMLDISNAKFESTKSCGIVSEDIKNMKLMSLGESLAFVQRKMVMVAPLKIWQVIGDTTRSPQWLYKYSFDASPDRTRGCKLLGMLSDGSFLVQVSTKISSFTPETKQQHILDFPEVLYCTVVSFVPSFISPSSFSAI